MAEASKARRPSLSSQRHDGCMIYLNRARMANPCTPCSDENVKHGFT